MFFKGSRYAKVDTLEMTDKNGRTVQYKAVRFIPKTEPVYGHEVKLGERPDHIAYEYFRDPEQYFRIADANNVFRPDELISEPGRKILIPSPSNKS